LPKTIPTSDSNDDTDEDSPIVSPTLAPETQSSKSPTEGPSSATSTTDPSSSPSSDPTTSPTDAPVKVTYRPGELTVNEAGLLLSKGLTAQIIARSERKVRYENGDLSDIRFHSAPDFGATFVDERPGNEGGWIYVSNSEVGERNHGGVGAITFDKDGNIIDFKKVLRGTTANCGGGRTPWGAWISCEEYENGKNWQVDPTGEREARRITLGNDGGNFESFAYDVRNENEPNFFVTEDVENGPTRRFTPNSPNWTDPWSILLDEGVTEYLLLYPQQGRYEWTENKRLAQQNARNNYPNCEGIDVHENELFMVSKRLKTLFILNLDDDTYASQSTRRGVFDGEPDQLKRILGDDDELLYFTEDGGRRAGVHGRNSKGQFFTILESRDYAEDETTGLAFSPDGRFLYVAYQWTGLLFEIKRRDGLPFQERSLNIKYHATEAN